jgi:uncharacterized protein YkwD
MAARVVRLGSLAFCTLAVGAAAPAGAQPIASSTSTQALEASVLADINGVRLAHGLRPLALSPGLSAAARQHSAEMAVHGYFEHSSADGTSFDRRIARYYPIGRFHYWQVGENLVYESPDLGASEAVNMWMHSPPHRANLLSRAWRQIGLSAVHVSSAPGEYEGMPVTIVTADFGLRR